MSKFDEKMEAYTAELKGADAGKTELKELQSDKVSADSPLFKIF